MPARSRSAAPTSQGCRPIRRDIGLVFQDYALFPHLTVAANINYGMKQRGVPNAEQDRRRAELLRLVRLEGLEERRPTALSGGQQQRVALARALAISPKLLLLDEPLSNLDAKLREALRIELRDILRAVGTTTLVVTHDQIEAIGLADRIALMNKGRIVQVGTAREIYRGARDAVRRRIHRSVDLVLRACRSDGTERCEFVTRRRPGVSRRHQRMLCRLRPVDPPGARSSAAAADDAIRIPATVTNVEFFGAELIVSCRLDSGRVMQDSDPLRRRSHSRDGTARRPRHLARSMQGGRR